MCAWRQLHSRHSLLNVLLSGSTWGSRPPWQAGVLSSGLSLRLKASRPPRPWHSLLDFLNSGFLGFSPRLKASRPRHSLFGWVFFRQSFLRGSLLGSTWGSRPRRQGFSPRGSLLAVLSSPLARRQGVRVLFLGVLSPLKASSAFSPQGSLFWAQDLLGRGSLLGVFQGVRHFFPWSCLLGILSSIHDPN